MANLLDLPRGSLLHWNGELVKVLERRLNPNRKPGVGRVSYLVEIALRRADGSIAWGVFHPLCVPARAVVPLD